MNKLEILGDLKRVLLHLESGETNGICLIANKKLTVTYVWKNRPNVLSKFFWTWSYSRLNGYWWPLNEVGMKQRIRFVKYLIKKLENEKSNVK